MTPTVGRIVHYYPDDSAVKKRMPFAAIVTRVWTDSCVNLEVFNDGGQPDRGGFAGSVERSDNPEDRHWMWPPRA